MFPSTPSPTAIANAVREYNARFGRDDAKLWLLAKQSAAARSLTDLDSLVGAVQNWGRIRGVWPAIVPLWREQSLIWRLISMARSASMSLEKNWSSNS